MQIANVRFRYKITVLYDILSYDNPVQYIPNRPILKPKVIYSDGWGKSSYHIEVNSVIAFADKMSNFIFDYELI